MQRESKKIKEEFGFDSEAEAVKEYHSLNREFMHLNYPLIADEIISRLNLEKGTILDIGTGLGSLAFEFARRLPQAKVYALDIELELEEGIRKKGLLDAMEGHIIDKAELIGLYKKH